MLKNHFLATELSLCLFILAVLQSYHTTATISKKTDFTILICSYNNEQWCERNILSALNQNYDPNFFRIVYINDCSTDKTAEKALQVIASHKQHSLITLLNNVKNKGSLRNKYDIINTLPDATVVVILDGDDWFPHDNVLNRLAKEYDTGNTWMTYGQYINWPSGKIGHAHCLPDWVHRQHAYRKYRGGLTALRSFYACLFKNIALENFKEDNAFFDAAEDMAYILSIAEMAGYHATFIPDVLYVYNQTNPISDFRVRWKRQAHLDNIVRSRPSYAKLTSLTSPLSAKKG